MVRGRPLIAYVHGEGEDGDGQCYGSFHIDITRTYVYMCEGRGGGGGLQYMDICVRKGRRQNS